MNLLSEAFSFLGCVQLSLLGCSISTCTENLFPGEGGKERATCDSNHGAVLINASLPESLAPKTFAAANKGRNSLQAGLQRGRHQGTAWGTLRCQHVAGTAAGHVPEPWWAPCRHCHLCLVGHCANHEPWAVAATKDTSKECH